MDDEAVAALRERLVQMRAKLIEQLVEQIDGGGIALLAQLHGAIGAIDATQDEGNAPIS